MLKGGNFVLNTFSYCKPQERFENGSDICECRALTTAQARELESVGAD